MKRFWFIFLFLVIFFLACFGLASMMDIPFASDPGHFMGKGGPLAALLGFLLLLSDILLPVPSSVVMIAHGSLFGPVAGTLLSLAGGLASSLLGYVIGKFWTKLSHRLLKEEERSNARAFMERWGSLAIPLSRPIPLLAESVSIMAGISGMPFWKMAIYSAIGLLPACLLYAITGAFAINLESGVLSFLLVVALSVATWLVGRSISKSKVVRK